MLVKFGFSSALSVPCFFWRLVLDLVLKTSNSARFVLLKSNEHCAKNNDDDVQDHMFRFIPLKEVDRSETIGEVATPKVLHVLSIRWY